MKKLYISLILLLVHSALCFSAVPKWLVNLEKEFPTEKYIRATGEGNSEISAKQAALAELSTYFSASVEYETYAHNYKSQNNSEYSSNSSITQDIMVTGSSDLFAIHYTQCYYDKKGKKYSVCAYINKEETFNILSKKLSSYEQDFYQKAKLTKTANDDFRKIKILNDAVSNEAEIKKIYEYSQLIDYKKSQKFDDFLLQLNEAKNTLFKLKQSNPVSVFTDGDYSEQIKSIISKVLTENGFVISKNADYKIRVNSSFYISERITEQDEIFSCKPSIYVVIESKTTTISSCVLSTEEISSYDSQTLMRMTFSRIEELLNEKLILSLFN